MAERGGVDTPDAPTAPVSFQDLGIPAPPKLQNTVFGKARQLKDIEWKERVFMFVTVLTLLVTFGFTVYKICTVSSDDPDFTFALVLLISHLFAFYYTIHGVLQERATELLVLCISIGIFIIYLIINYAAGKRDTIKLVRLVVGVVVGPVLLVMGVYLSFGYYRSGNLIFRTVGANGELQNMCRLIFLFFDTLKFDLQLSISMVIFILTSQVVDTEDIVVLSVGGVITLVVFVIAYDSMKRELRCGAFIFFALSPLEVAYIIYKLKQTAEYITTRSGLAGSTIACGILALVIRVFLMVIAYFVFRNFNKGLKEKAFGIGSAEEHRLREGEFVP